MCNNWQYFDGNDNYRNVEGVDADDQKRTFAGGLCKHWLISMTHLRHSVKYVLTLRFRGSPCKNISVSWMQKMAPGTVTDTWVSNYLELH